MPKIRSIDILFLDEFFEMGGGYVLNFSDRTMSQFFAEELNVDIDDPMYAVYGGSKGTLSRELPLNHVLESKVRRAAETALPFAQVRDLFP